MAEDPKEKKVWWSAGVALAGQLSSWIVGPIILAIIIGKWLDAKYKTEPWLFLVCICVAFIISNIGIIAQTLKYIKQIEKDKKNSNKQDNNK